VFRAFKQKVGRGYMETKKLLNPPKEADVAPVKIDLLGKKTEKMLCSENKKRGN